MRIEGQVALVTGGGSGLGAATARLLAERGARVAVLDFDKARADAVAAEIGGLGVQADVGSEPAVAAAFEAVKAHFGAAPRIAVNCAGIGVAAPGWPGFEWRRQGTMSAVRRAAHPGQVSLDVTRYLPVEPPPAPVPRGPPRTTRRSAKAGPASECRRLPVSDGNVILSSGNSSSMPSAAPPGRTGPREAPTPPSGTIAGEV